MKVVISAQDHGFLPASYAFLIAREAKALFNNVTFSLIDTKSVRMFNQNNLDFRLPIESTPDWTTVDCLISFYEPEQLFEAWLHKIPTLYYCNRLPLWLEKTRLPMDQISEYVLSLYVLRQAKEYDAARDMLNSLEDRDVFAFQLACYFLADKIFCQPDAQISKDIARLPKSIQEKTRILGIPELSASDTGRTIMVETNPLPQQLISSKKFVQVILNQLFELLSPQQLSSIKFFRPVQMTPLPTEQAEKTEIAQP